MEGGGGGATYLLFRKLDFIAKLINVFRELSVVCE